MEYLVTVICCTYNHSNYIRKCLDGFVSQKTNFNFLVLVHDDASTDNTADIVREYEAKYPEKIRGIYQKENQYSQHLPFVRKCVLPNIQGKYIAFCEGDDYWCNPDKLQMQVDALEDNPDCSMCLARVKVIAENGDDKGYCFPAAELKEQVYNSRQFISLALFQRFQISGLVIKAKEYMEYLNNPPEFRKKAGHVGDVSIVLYFSHVGDVYYIDKALSCYRFDSVASWSSKFRSSTVKKKVEQRERSKRVYEEFDKYTEFKYHDACAEKIRQEDFSIAKLRCDFKTIWSMENRGYLRKCSLKLKILYSLGRVFPTLAKYLVMKFQ